jgi:hypothetical protein
MKSLFAILLSIIFINTVKGQEKTDIGVIITPQYANLSPNPGKSVLNIKYNAGVLVGYYLFQNLKVSSGLIFSEQGSNFQQNDMYFNTAKISLNYLKIPLFISSDFFKIKRLNCGFIAGVSYDRLIGYSNNLASIAKYPIGLIIPAPNADNYSYSLGIKVNYEINRHFDFYSAITYTRGINKIYKYFEWTSFQTGDSRNELIGLSIGLNYKLSKVRKKSANNLCSVWLRSTATTQFA